MTTGAKALKDWMIRRGFLHREAANHFGFHETYISQLVNGSRTPSLKNAVKIERETGIPVSTWLSRPEDFREEPATVGASKRRQTKA